MKHLRLFETFIYDINPSQEGLIEDIKDICIELDDIGLKTIVYPMLDKITYSIIIEGKDNDSYVHAAISDTKNDKYFDYKDVSEVVDRLKEYLGGRLKELHAYGNDWEWINIKNMSDSDYLDFGLDIIYSVKIEFVI